jgi:hypothetical protein
VAAASFPLQPVDGRSSLTIFRGWGVIAPLGKSGKQFLLLSDYLNQSDETGNFCIPFAEGEGGGGWRVGRRGAGLAVINNIQNCKQTSPMS